MRVEVSGVTHTHGTGTHAVHVLHDVSFTAAAGEFLALAGRSGSGKSTLCHLLAGTTRPDRGIVCVEGRPAHEVDDWSLRSFLPQRLGIAEELSVAENAFLPARLLGRADAPDLLERLALAHLAGRPGVDTSLGEQQRTGLARALSVQPALLVLDEPTGHQDDDNVQLVLAELVRARDQGTTVVVATHDPRVIEVADRVVALAGGRVV